MTAVGPTNATISGLDIFNLVSAIASIVLAIVALVLAIFFFVQSKNEAERSAKSANEISSSVDRLEKIFDKLYSDTFSIMRETVTDMRQHIWKVLPVEASSDAQEVDYQSRIDALKRSVAEQVERPSPTMNAPKDPYMRDILALLTERPMSAIELISATGLSEADVVGRVFDLRASGIATWDGDLTTLPMRAPIRLRINVSDSQQQALDE
jgi:hypothetical protein